MSTIDAVTFYDRMVNAGKARADECYLITLALGTASIYNLIPKSFCPPDMRGDICSFQYSLLGISFIWIVLSFLRAGFIASKWHAGPFLKSSGLMIERRNGKPITFGFALKYVLIEWLPIHILSVWFLFFKIPPTLYDIVFVLSLFFLIQLLWSLTSAFLTGTRVVALPKKKGGIQKAYDNKRRLKLYQVDLALRWLGFFGSIALSALILIQMIRMPAVSSEYERLLYADKAPIWDDNLYIAIEGLLAAPADVRDTYSYGRAKTLKAFMNFEEFKKASHIPYAYQIPEEYKATLSLLRPADESKLSDKSWKKLQCVYDMNTSRTDECATREDIHAYIRENRLIWDRFDALPAYTTYHVVPQFLGSRIDGFRQLAQLKDAYIVDLAETGRPQDALAEWLRLIKIYRSMAPAHDTMVFRAIFMFVFNGHLATLEKLLYLHPQLAVSHAGEITSALRPPETGLFHPENLLSDEVSLVEPAVLSVTGNTNALRNDMHDCIVNLRKRAEIPLHEFPFGQDYKLCGLDGMSTHEMIKVLFLRPGNFISNALALLISPTSLKGKELVGVMKEIEVRMRLTLLGSKILEQGIAPADIPAFLAATPPDLYNPITQKPFEWDAATKSLFYIRPFTLNARREFRLNL